MSASSDRGLLIIGNGVTGISAARRVRQLAPETAIRIVADECSHFFSRTALMYIYMGHMRQIDTEPYDRQFWAKNRLQLIQDRATAIDPAAGRAQLASGAALDYDFLLLATGARYNRFGWPGQDLQGVLGLYSLSDLQEIEKYSDGRLQQAVLVGGGLIGVELAEMLHSRGVQVTMLVREKGYWGNILPPEESQLVEGELLRHGIVLRLETELASIEGDASGRAAAVRTTAGERLPCQMVGLTAGVSPNLDLARQIPGLQLRRGIVVDRWLRTNLPGIFAAGDCAELSEDRATAGRVEQLWYTGRMQGEAAANSIGWMLKRKASFQQLPELAAPYERGIWFNSAKFFHLEYQTYGQAPAEPAPGRSHVWVDARRRRLIRLYWDESGAISGYNFMGLRFRQQTCSDWIAAQRPWRRVAEQLREAAFDPEFSADFHGSFMQSLGALSATH
ncbi:MAG: NAD(P)/FAD-dependent oxidoreductase [Leptospirales bacterium]|nr:NAD(P)/FAD-dependent oxidoreductase [Leptospirales bacterium]